MWLPSGLRVVRALLVVLAVVAILAVATVFIESGEPVEWIQEP